MKNTKNEEYKIRSSILNTRIGLANLDVEIENIGTSENQMKKILTPKQKKSNIQS